jgi:acyl-coenzyme A thioesterase PaaI-like protein
MAEAMPTVRPAGEDKRSGLRGALRLPAGSGYTTIETKANFARPITGKSLLSRKSDPP